MLLLITNNSSPCKCGCGNMANPERMFLCGHNNNRTGKTSSEEHRKKILLSLGGNGILKGGLSEI